MSRLAVLIPVYRNQQGLDRTLDSLRGARGNFDTIIVDDGSPEPIVILSTGNQAPPTLLRLMPNVGIASALNHGLGYILSRGYQYVARLDSGDTVAPERFDEQVAFLDAHPDHGVVGSFVDFVDANQNLLFRHRAPCDHPRILRRMRLNNCIIHSGSTIRASVLRDCGLYKEDVSGAEDHELFLRIAERYRLAVLPRLLTRCEYSFGGLSVAGRRRQQRTRLRLQFRYFDAGSPHSFFGIARTLLAMLIPHATAYRLKRAYLR